MRKKGIKNPEVAQTVQMSKESTSRIWTLYKHGGQKAIEIQKKGKKDGDKKSSIFNTPISLHYRIVKHNNYKIISYAKTTIFQQIRVVMKKYYSLNS